MKNKVIKLSNVCTCTNYTTCQNCINKFLLKKIEELKK